MKSFLTLGLPDAGRARDGGSGTVCPVVERILDSRWELDNLEDDDSTRS